MFNGELLNLLAPGIDLNTLEKVSLGGVGGTAEGYVTHIEVGVDNTFLSVPAIFSFEFSPDEFGGLAGQLGFFDAFKIQFDRTEKEFHLTLSLLSLTHWSVQLLARSILLEPTRNCA